MFKIKNLTEIKDIYKKVVVILGGNSSEREISLISGNAVYDSLYKSGINVEKFDPSKESIFDLKDRGFDAAIIMLHGGNGEDGTIQAVLSLMKIPYNGSKVMASSIAMDKYRTKLIWQTKDIPMSRGQHVTINDYQAKLFNLELDLPVIVKPNNGGSTIGMSKVYDIESLTSAIEIGLKYSDSVLLEELVLGDEYSVTVVDGKMLPIVKIIAPNKDYDYNNKYFNNDTQYQYPVIFNNELDEKLKLWCHDAYKTINTSGITRIDFMVDNNNNVFFLEINTIPGMTSHSLVPMSFQAIGYSFDQVCLFMLQEVGY
jgi:D-alanine-D-alanine ligase